MKALLLGTGLQGRAALHDLLRNPAVDSLVAADEDAGRLQEALAGAGSDARLRGERFRADDPAGLQELLSATAPDVILDLLPPDFNAAVAAAAIGVHAHLVNTCYVKPGLHELDGPARAAGVSILPEFGMDPGIDLVLLGAAVRRFDEVERIAAYGAGLPAPEAADNPLRYKVTWTFAGVLRAYRRGAKVVRDGRVVELTPSQAFAADQVHEVDVPGLGKLEAYANGDALPYAGALGLDPARLRELGRYTLRWPGHCEFWKRLIDLHLLDEEPVWVGGAPVDRLRYLAEALEPHIRLQAHESDVALIRVEVQGRRGEAHERLLYEVSARRDLASGLTGMSRLVGFSAAIGAAMLGDGRIRKRGLLSPLGDVPEAAFRAELARRGIEVRRTVLPPRP